MTILLHIYLVGLFQQAHEKCMWLSMKWIETLENGMVRSREEISISSLDMSKWRFGSSLTVMLRVPVMEKKLKVTASMFFLYSSNFCEKSITLKIRMSIFCCLVKIWESKKPGIKKKCGLVLNQEQFKDFSYFFVLMEGRKRLLYLSRNHPLENVLN